MNDLEVLRVLLNFATLTTPKTEELADAILWARAKIRRMERNELRRVIVESPYSGEVAENRAYALRCLRDSVQRGEAPFVSHLLYPLVSRKYDADERRHGMACGWAWARVAHACIVYRDRGVTAGMQQGIDLALREEIPVEERRLEDNQDK